MSIYDFAKFDKVNCETLIDDVRKCIINKYKIFEGPLVVPVRNNNKYPYYFDLLKCSDVKNKLFNFAIDNNVKILYNKNKANFGFSSSYLLTYDWYNKELTIDI